MSVRVPDPIDLRDPRGGHRFDSGFGSFVTTYCSTTLEAALGETMAEVRPSPVLAELVRSDWQKMGGVEIGGVTADWRERRTAFELSVPLGSLFLDVEHLQTHLVLREVFGTALSDLGYEDLDVSVVRGSDRRVTRVIAEWAYAQPDDIGEPRFAGVRYLSRLSNEWENWAVFDRTPLTPVRARPLLRDMPELVAVAKMYGLTLHGH